MPILDFHAHIYPDAIAKRASDVIGEFYDIPMAHDGTLGALLEAGDKAGITQYVVHSVAVTWERAAKINNFIAKSVAAHPDTLLGFATMHPAHPEMEKELERAMDMGLRGVKIHPDFQHFHIDDKEAYPMYEWLAGRYPLLVHTGDWRYDTSRPDRMAKVLSDFPKLRVVCAHLGGWSQWKEAYRVLSGYENAWIDTSSSLYALSPEEAREIISHYNMDKVLFGTDYPMWDPGEELDRFHALGYEKNAEMRILYENGARLLGL